jgi:hypothetical protein
LAITGEYGMITKEGKIELIDQYLKKLGGEKYISASQK